MSLTVGPFSRPKVVVWAQVWVFRVTIRRLIRILARFGRTGLPRVSRRDHFDILHGLLARDSCELREIRPQIQILHKKVGSYRVVSGSARVISGRATVRFLFPGRAGPAGTGVRNSGPVRGSGIPNRTLT